MYVLSVAEVLRFVNTELECVVKALGYMGVLKTATKRQQAQTIKCVTEASV